MNKQLVSIAVLGIAVVSVIGAGIVGPMRGVAQADSPREVGNATEYTGTSPDLPEMLFGDQIAGHRVNSLADTYGFDGTMFPGTSPDLPEMLFGDQVADYRVGTVGFGSKGINFRETSSNLPWLGVGSADAAGNMQNQVEKDTLRAYVGTSPDLPDLN